MVLGQFYSNNPSTISPPFLNVSLLYFYFVDPLYPLHSCNSKLSNFTQAQSLHQFEFPFTQPPSKTIQLPPKDPCGLVGNKVDAAVRTLTYHQCDSKVRQTPYMLVEFVIGSLHHSGFPLSSPKTNTSKF